MAQSPRHPVARATLGGAVLALVASGCLPGGFSTANAPPIGGELRMDYLPRPAVIGRPITVLGYCSIPPKQLDTTIVRIQLAPLASTPELRVDIGTASLESGHFSWTDTLNPTYGGVSLEASRSYGLVALLGTFRSQDGTPVSWPLESALPFTPVATAGP